MPGVHETALSGPRGRACMTGTALCSNPHYWGT